MEHQEILSGERHQGMNEVPRESRAETSKDATH